MPENIERISNQDNHEQLDSDVLNRQIGAQALTVAGFENRQKEIVDSSFNKAREQGEKLPGKNNERRNYAYLSRLENLIEKHGNHLEKKLWEGSANKLIIKPENITDGYWKTQEQILRDNGQGRELSGYEKSLLTEDIQKQQKESLESWSNYLGDKNSPYPLWFKIYAWDGMSKMGAFDKEAGYFKKRDEHTVAPYPKLNPAALAKTYNVIANFYNISDRERYEEDEEKDKILETLAASGNFNKLYSKVLLREKAIPKTPEKTEDIHGEWVEYLPGDEERLANAAEGTPWCIADPGTGRNYLIYGSSYAGQDDDEDDDEYRDQAKFILFHLYDPEKNTLSESACASIRLGLDGNVAEISGLNEGQALEDSLVPIVKEKVKSLPGGEEYLEAFADKQELIRLDHKMQKDEELTKEELEFIYEINRPIKTLDTYNSEDPRIDELRVKYSPEYALNAGIDVNQLVSNLHSDYIVKNLDTLIDHGANIDINQLVSKLHPYYIAKNLGTLIDHGANIDINQLVSNLHSDHIVKNLDTLIDHGANIDINQLISGPDFYPYEIAENLDTLIDHGANIDINQLVSGLYPCDIAGYLDTLIDHGANIDINQLVSELNSDEIAGNIDTLRAHGYQG